MININILQWVLLRLIERLSWQGCAGTLMLVAALPAYLWIIKPLHNELAASMQLASQPQVINQTKISDADQLNAFLKAFPSQANRAASVQAVMDIAAEERVLPDDVVYKTVQKVDDAIAHYQIEFTLVASYREIQHFLSTLLHRLNYVSIDSVLLSREVVQDEVIEARIRLVLHFNLLDNQAQTQQGAQP